MYIAIYGTRQCRVQAGYMAMFGTSRVHGNVGYKQGTWQCLVQAGYMAM